MVLEASGATLKTAAAAASDPPEWALDLWPLDVIAGAWDGWTEPELDQAAAFKPDPLIAAALRLGGVVVGTVTP